MGGPNNNRILVPRKREMLFQMVLQGKKNAEIQTALGRPTLDVDWFRIQTPKYGFNITTADGKTTQVRFGQ